MPYGDKKLKKRIYPLVLIALLSMAAIVPAVFADAALTNERFRATGNYDIVAAGVGLQDVTDGEIDLNIPDSGTSVVIAAYLYWSGYNPNTGGDNEVYFQGALTPAPVLDTFGPDLWYADYYCYVFVADVTSDIQLGDHTYTIESVEFERNFGAGIIVVYESEDLPLAEVTILDGLDNFWFGWPDQRGPNSEVTAFTFDDSIYSRNSELVLFAGATEHDDRPNEIWTQTGTAPAPLPTEDLIPSPSPSTADGNYPLVGSDGHSWDTYIADVTIPAGDEWLALQVESLNTGAVGADPPHDGRGSSGVLIAGGFVLPIPTLDGLSPGFWKHNIAVYLGENPGRYSVPHDGEPRITDAILEGYFYTIGVTDVDAYAALTANGKGNNIIRLGMANLFNAAAGYTPYSD